MDSPSLYGIYIVAATGDGKTQLWAAAGTPGRALADVRKYLPSGWIITLTGECLTSREAEILGIGPDDVRKIRDTP
jgi:hypothetical protein